MLPGAFWPLFLVGKELLVTLMLLVHNLFLSFNILTMLYLSVDLFLSYVEFIGLRGLVD